MNTFLLILLMIVDVVGDRSGFVGMMMDFSTRLLGVLSISLIPLLIV